LKGKVVALIWVNQSGSEKLSREIPESGEDLNRVFGGKVDGTVAEKLAYNIREEIFRHKSNLLIDLHNDYFFSTPYILLDPKSMFSESLYIDTAGIAISSGLNAIQERDDERQVYENSLSAYCVSKNIPAITIEGGPDKLILKKHIDVGFEALVNILIGLEMLPKNILNKKKRVGVLKSIGNSLGVKENRVLLNGETVKVSEDGNVQYMVDAGEYVKKGVVLAKLRNEFGEGLEKILCPHDAFVLGHSEKINVEAGDEIYWLAKI
jgi:predicted deacylase